MTYGPVGIRCPDHATTGGKTAAPRQAAQRVTRSLSLSGPIVTFTLIGINVGVFLLELLMGAGISAQSGWIYEHGVLVSSAVDSADRSSASRRASGGGSSRPRSSTTAPFTSG